MQPTQVFLTPTGLKFLFSKCAGEMVDKLWDKETIINHLPSPTFTKNGEEKEIAQDWEEYVVPGIADDTKQLFDSLEEGFVEKKDGSYTWDIPYNLIMDAAMMVNHGRMEICLPKDWDNSNYGDIIPPSSSNPDYLRFGLYTALNEFLVEYYLNSTKP